MKQKLLHTLIPKEKVDLKDVFENEPKDFTPWLAQEENLEILNETLGLDIVLEGTEVPVGRKFVDMVGFDRKSGRKVVIENQLNKFDHDHLGKAVTYAAGLDASIIIGIFEQIGEEHRAALDWLNEKFQEGTADWFGIEVNVWKVGKNHTIDFKIRVKPNNWKKSVKIKMSKRISNGPQPMSIEFNGEKLDYSSATDCYKDVIERTYKIKGPSFIKEALRKSQPGEEWHGKKRPYFSSYDTSNAYTTASIQDTNGKNILYYDTNNFTDLKVKRMEQITNTCDIPFKVITE